MPAADFAAAQARLEARRQQREAAEIARRAEHEAARTATVSRVPWPFRTIGDAGLSVWDSIRGREGTRPAFRVGQVDAELLDEELLELLKGQVGEALKYYGVCLAYLKLLVTILPTWVLVPLADRLRCRDPACSPRHPFQTLNLGPQCFIRCFFTRPSLYRCPSELPFPSSSDPNTKSHLRPDHSLRPLWLVEMGNISTG
jgi:hypothetical protein